MHCRNKPNLKGQVSEDADSALCCMRYAIRSRSASWTLLLNGTADSRPSSYTQYTLNDKNMSTVSQLWQIYTEPGVMHAITTRRAT